MLAVFMAAAVTMTNGILKDAANAANGLQDNKTIVHNGFNENDPLYRWVRVRSIDDIPEPGKPFKILMMDRVSATEDDPNDDTDGKWKNDRFSSGDGKAEIEFYGGDQIYYLGKTVDDDTGNLEIQLTLLTGNNLYQVDYGGEEFITIGDLDTPDAVRLIEDMDDTSSADYQKGYVGWVNEEMATRHLSTNRDGVKRSSPLIKISTNNNFTHTANTLDWCTFGSNTYMTNWTRLTKHQQNAGNSFHNFNNIFELVVTSDKYEKAGYNAAYTEADCFISHPMSKLGGDSAYSADEALYFTYYSSHINDLEYAKIGNIPKGSTSNYNKWMGPVYLKHWECQYYHGRRWVSTGNGGYYIYWDNYNIRVNTARTAANPVFRYKNKTDDRDKYTQYGHNKNLLNLPIIYIGRTDNGLSELAPNGEGADANAYVVREGETLNINNTTYIRSNRKIKVEKGGTLAVGGTGWLCIHGTLVVDGGTVIVDGGGCIAYLDRDTAYNTPSNGKRDIQMKNKATMIILAGGKVAACAFEAYDSSIINYGLFISGWDYRQRTQMECRRNSTTYEGVERVYPTYVLSSRYFTKTGEGSGIPERVFMITGNDFVGHGSSSDKSKIIISDMKNLYKSYNDEKRTDNRHVPTENYYEKQ